MADYEKTAVFAGAYDSLDDAKLDLSCPESAIGLQTA